MKEPKLKDRVAVGVAWNMAEKVGSMLLQAVVSIVILNMIDPMDVGVMAILTVFTAVGLAVVDSGFSQTLIRKVEPTANEYKSVFIFNLVSAIILYGLFTAIAPFVAEYYDAPVVARIAPVLFLLFPINALCIIHNTILTRQFRFALMSKIVFISSLVSGVIAIGMAMAGMGVWCLVGQRLSAMAVKAILLWFLGSWRPKAAYDAKALKQMAPFSLRLVATDLIAVAYNNVSSLFIGRIYSKEILGFYSQGQKLKDYPVTSTIQSVQNVTYSALSKIGNDEQKFTESYRQVVMVVAFVMFPLMLGMEALAEDGFVLLLNEKWMPVVPYFRIACLAGLFAPIAAISYNVLKVKSNGRIIVRLEILKRVVMTIMLAATIPVNALAITWGLTAMALFEMMVNFVASTRYTRLTIWRFIRTLAPIAAAACVMYAAIWLVGTLQIAPAIRFVIRMASGIAVYFTIGYLFRMEAMREMIGILRQFLRR